VTKSMVKWKQSPKELAFSLPLPDGARAKDITFQLTSLHLFVAVRGEEILKSAFFLPCRPDDSTWAIEDAIGGSRELRIGIAKAKPNQPWDCLFLDEIDDSITHHVFMDISISGVPAGRVVFGLYGKACPRTVENFRCLCTGERGSVKMSKKHRLRLHYKGTSFHRVLPGLLCQGGDLTHDPNGGGGCSIYGAVFDDENFKIKHTGEGQLLMANFGVANNNHSQFAIPLSKIKEFDTRHVIFGKVTSGMEVLKAMELEGAGDGVPTRPVVIDECGELDEKGQVILELTRDDEAERPTP